MGTPSEQIRNESSSTSGFSLVQVSVLVLMFGLMLAAILPGGEQNSPLKKAEKSLDRMKVIEDTLKGFYAAYGRIPCPADATYPIGDVNYGVEAANEGECTGGTPESNFSTSTVVAGMLPVKTLALENSYAVDAFGRHVTYVVDTQFTSACTAATATSAIVLTDDDAATTNPPYILLSHGEDGHGAYVPLAGTTGTAVRFSKGTSISDADTLENASADSSFADDFDVNFVKKSKTPAFDDIVDTAALPSDGPTGGEEFPILVSYNATPRLLAFEFSPCSETLTRITDPNTQTTNISGALDVSSSGSYVVYGSHYSTAFKMYKRSGAQFESALVTTSGSPTNYVRAAIFSPSEDFMVLHSTATSPYLALYSRAGDTFTKTTDPSPAPEGAAQNSSTSYASAAFSPDNAYLAVAHQTTPYLSVYVRSGTSNSFVEVTTAGVNPSYTPLGTGTSVSWNAAGDYLLLTTADFTERAVLFSHSGDTFTKVSHIGGYSYLSEFSPVSEHVALASSAAPNYLQFYMRSATTLVALTNPSTQPASYVTGLDWSDDGIYLFVSVNSASAANNLKVYKRSGDTLTYLTGNPDATLSSGGMFNVKVGRW